MKSRNLKALSVTMMLVVGIVGMSGRGEASNINEAEPNNSIETAQNVDASFSLDYDVNIESGDNLFNSSTEIPHVSISGTGDGSFDYYSFTVSSAAMFGIFDVDFAEMYGLDAYLQLYNSAGELLAENDDSDFDGPGDELEYTVNSFLTYSFESAGEYIIGMAMYGPEAIPQGMQYTLHASIQGHAIGEAPNPVATPEPGTVFLLGTGMLGLIGLGRKKLLRK